MRNTKKLLHRFLSGKYQTLEFLSWLETKELQDIILRIYKPFSGCYDIFSEARLVSEALFSTSRTKDSDVACQLEVLELHPNLAAVLQYYPDFRTHLIRLSQSPRATSALRYKIFSVLYPDLEQESLPTSNISEEYLKDFDPKLITQLTQDIRFYIQLLESDTRDEHTKVWDAIYLLTPYLNPEDRGYLVAYLLENFSKYPKPILKIMIVLIQQDNDSNKPLLINAIYSYLLTHPTLDYNQPGSLISEKNFKAMLAALVAQGTESNIEAWFTDHVKIVGDQDAPIEKRIFSAQFLEAIRACLTEEQQLVAIQQLTSIIMSVNYEAYYDGNSSCYEIDALINFADAVGITLNAFFQQLQDTQSHKKNLHDELHSLVFSLFAEDSKNTELLKNPRLPWQEFKQIWLTKAKLVIVSIVILRCQLPLFSEKLLMQLVDYILNNYRNVPKLVEIIEAHATPAFIPFLFTQFDEHLKSPKKDGPTVISPLTCLLPLLTRLGPQLNADQKNHILDLLILRVNDARNASSIRDDQCQKINSDLSIFIYAFKTGNDLDRNKRSIACLLRITRRFCKDRLKTISMLQATFPPEEVSALFRADVCHLKINCEHTDIFVRLAEFIPVVNVEELDVLVTKLLHALSVHNLTDQKLNDRVIEQILQLLMQIIQRLQPTHPNYLRIAEESKVFLNHKNYGIRSQAFNIYSAVLCSDTIADLNSVLDVSQLSFSIEVFAARSLYNRMVATHTPFRTPQIQ